MLCLSRKTQESILIGQDITITILDVDRGKVRIGIQAPRDVVIMRTELIRCEPGDEVELGEAGA